MIRRQIPRLLLAVLTAGTGVAAWLAVRDAPSSAPQSGFLSQALAATVHAGTAQFTLSDQYGGGTRTVGFGSVNFRTDAVDVLISTDQTEQVTTPLSPPHAQRVTITMQEIHADGHTFNRPTLPNQPTQPSWIQLSALPDVPGPLGQRRTTEAAEAISPLVTLADGTAFATGRSATVAGVATVVHRRVPVVQTCHTVGTGGTTGYRSTSTNSLTVWLDHQGRIRQVRSTMSGVERGAHQPTQHFHNVSVLTFTSFGKPAPISAPPVGKSPTRGGRAVMFGANVHTTCSS
ncbi:MAG TPA: hypothetical protein VHV57_03425 [Acidimicrobiales bacterium]|nr:hypothetical protein [Acidimicrobiales bacterium]